MSQTVKHYGFAQIPRLVTRGERFKDLSLTEIGLYAGLKDICGDDGECFFALRNLARELHTSISTLSRYIPQLRDKWNLIAAEKKIRGSGANKHEVWHIRIINIWQENDELYKPADKDCFTEKQNNDNSVSQRNNSSKNTKIVSQRNNSVSQGNKDCFNLTDRIITNSNNNHKGDSIFVATQSVDDTTPSLTNFSSLSNEQLLQEMQRRGILSQPEQLSTANVHNQPATVDIHHKAETTADTILQASAVSDSQHSAALPALPNTPVPVAVQQPASEQPAKEKSSKGKRGSGKKESSQPTPKKPPEMPPADMPWGTKKCIAIFDARRGKPLIGTYALSQASTCAKGLAESYTEAEVMLIADRMNADPYWIERGGADICDVARNIHKEMKKPQNAKPTHRSNAPSRRAPEPFPVDQYTARSLDKEYNQRQLEKMRAEVEEKKRLAAARAAGQ